MSIIVWIVIGLLLGVVARLLRGGRSAPGWIAALTLGVASSLLFGYLGSVMLKADLGAMWEPIGLISATAGAFVVLLGWVLERRRRERHEATTDPGVTEDR